MSPPILRMQPTLARMSLLESPGQVRPVAVGSAWEHTGATLRVKQSKDAEPRRCNHHATGSQTVSLPFSIERARVDAQNPRCLFEAGTLTHHLADVRCLELFQSDPPSDVDEPFRHFVRHSLFQVGNAIPQLLEPGQALHYDLNLCGAEWIRQVVKRSLTDELDCLLDAWIGRGDDDFHA